MAGLNDLVAQVQPKTGPASLDAVVAALSPDQALAAQGIDPYGNDQGMLGGQPGMLPPQTKGAAPAPVGLTPENRMAIGAMLQETLNAIGQPGNEADAVAAQSIQNAIAALVGG